MIFLRNYKLKALKRNKTFNGIHYIDCITALKPENSHHLVYNYSNNVYICVTPESIHFSVLACVYGCECVYAARMRIRDYLIM